MKFLPNAVSRKVARQSLLLQKNAPTLLFGAGVVGVVGSTVLACRATLKIEGVLLEAASTQADILNLNDDRYSEADRQQDLKVLKVRTAVSIGKLYAPAVGLGVLSVGALTKSHNLLQQRNAALGAAYIAVSEGFDNYRARVVDKFGTEQDQEFRYGAKEVEFIDDKGKVQKARRVSEHADYSVYARFFDEFSKSWNREPEYNLLFLKAQQNYANDLLHSRGHLFLNEVYDMLGIERSKAGQVVGWAITNGDGDNYVDFGIYEGTRDAVRDFVNGREGAILLDFNVDGVIMDLISDKEVV